MERTRTVLLVDDDAALCDFGATVLRRSGYEVLTAHGGLDALRLAADHQGPIDLLVTDVIMPGVGGRELAWRLTDARPGVRVLFVSGYVDAENVGEGLNLGEAGFILKPFTAEQLVAAMRDLLHSDEESRDSS